MKSINRIIILCLSLVFGTFGVFAQSSIFNTPSTDVTGEKKINVEADFIAHFDKWEKGGFQIFGYRMMYGIRKNLEIGANVFYTRDGGSASPKQLQLNAKYKVYEKEKYGLAITTGAQVYLPLNRSAGTCSFAMLYSNASKIVKQTGETRLTGGFYTIVGAEPDFGTKRGVLLGVEQPIKGKLSFVADWSSGKNNFGYSAAGFSYALTKKQFLTIGYSFGNSGRGNNGLGIFYGHTF